MSTAVRRVPQTKPDRIDPITTSVIQGALENIAVEMGYKLMRMSYSSIIRESGILAQLWSTPRAAGSPSRRNRRRCSRARSRATSAVSRRSSPRVAISSARAT